MCCAVDPVGGGRKNEGWQREKKYQRWSRIRWGRVVVFWRMKKWESLFDSRLWRRRTGRVYKKKGKG